MAFSRPLSDEVFSSIDCLMFCRFLSQLFRICFMYVFYVRNRNLRLKVFCGGSQRHKKKNLIAEILFRFVLSRIQARQVLLQAFLRF